MSSPVQQLQDNWKYALRLMAKDLSTEWLSKGIFTANGLEYDKVLPKTWGELVASGYLVAVKPTHAPAEYTLTAKGWLTGAQLLGVTDTPVFKENLEKLSRGLKELVRLKELTQGKVKEQECLSTVKMVAVASGLSIGFIRNAIDCDLLGLYLHQPGVSWEAPAGRGWTVRIPRTFGMETVI